MPEGKLVILEEGETLREVARKGNVVLYTTAGKVTYDLKGPVKFEADGNREGVQPGVLVKDKDEVVAWVSAQAHILILVEDERLVSVEAAAQPPAGE